MEERLYSLRTLNHLAYPTCAHVDRRCINATEALEDWSHLGGMNGQADEKPRW